VQQAAQSTVQDLFIPQQALAIFDAAGRLLAERHANDQAQVRLPELSLILAGQPFLFTSAAAGGPQRVAAQRLQIAPDDQVYLVAIGQSFKTVTDELAVLRQIFLITVPLALLLAGAGGWLLACKSLAPVVMMSASARRISAENLGERLPLANPRDELGQLAATFNQLLARLDAAFAQQRQFMADASHELRTPLSVLRTAAAVTLEQPHRGEAEYRAALALVHEQARRLTRIVEEMFTLARADAGRRPIEARDFYLDELVNETARAASVLARRKNIAIEITPTRETPFHGDEDLLRQLLLNLLDNAIKFTPVGGAIRLELEQRNGTHQLSVADTGTGIPVAAQPHIFERFYRVDKARSRAEQEQGSGAGLGLSIARWIAEAHGGSLRLAKSASTGSTFIVTLPAHSTR
jgi:two-component system, OmpR family, sensor kinase